MKDICILGAGISGLALAANLQKDAEILEKNINSGGLCSTIIEGGFTFDIGGPHILFSKNKEVLNYMVSVLGDNVDKKVRNVKILYNGNMVKYPFENGLSDLSKEECFECIRDYLNNNYKKEPENLEEWAYFTFGKSISEKYFLPYNRKIWNCEPSQISLSWVSRIPKPPIEDVLKSAIGIPTEGYLHQLHYFYPKKGGYQALTDALTKKVINKISFNEEVLKIKKITDGWEVTTVNEVKQYKTLVSTLPIHKLLNILEDCPPEAIAIANSLHVNGLINVLIGFKEDKNIPYIAVYVPDSDIIFHRITFLKNFSEHNVPNECASIMTEITANHTDDIWKKNDDEIINIVVSDLEKLNLIKKENIVYTKVIKITYAYPIYDLNYYNNTSKLHLLMENMGIHLLGRFARFEYINSDVCVERALILAKELNK